ncbi:MAG: hypothetical protein ABIF19_01885 [Planctomycetota bacterium]
MTDRKGGGSLGFGSAEIEKSVRALKKIDFELAYLALLTHEGLKPLSRWEKELDDGGLGLLRQMGLLTKQVRRTAKTGREIVETVFSRTPAYIQLYEHCFSDTPIDKSAQTQRFEGFLFGYPPCCVSQFISRPYAPNGLNAQEQEILFHWACKDCKITPLLARSYASAHALISNC